MGRQQQAGGPGQHGHGSAPGTVTPAGTGPVLSPPPAKGGPQLPGARAHLCWATPPHVCARESSSRPSFPSRYLARSLRVTIPTTCHNRDRISLMWSSQAHTEPGDSLSLSPGGAQAAGTQRAGTHLVAIVHDHQVPQAQRSEELEHAGQGRLLQGRTGLGAAAAPPGSPHCPP